MKERRIYLSAAISFVLRGAPMGRWFPRSYGLQRQASLTSTRASNNAMSEEPWDRKLNSWYMLEARWCQQRAGWNLPRTVPQSCGWKRRSKRCETVCKRHLKSLQNVPLALSKSSSSLLPIIKISVSRTRLAEGLNRKVKCVRSYTLITVLTPRDVYKK